MPIRLDPPTYRPGGPDGNGWNRLSLNAHMGAGLTQCALRPRSYPLLWECQDTRRSQWGGYRHCIRPEQSCDGCPVLTRQPRELQSVTPVVLVRLKEHQGNRGIAGQSECTPWVMNRPDNGWGEHGEPWSWEDLARVPGWRVGRQYRDVHSEGFWLHACRRKTAGGAYVYGVGDVVPEPLAAIPARHPGGTR
jgi:hypothetical protein